MLAALLGSTTLTSGPLLIVLQIFGLVAQLVISLLGILGVGGTLLI